MPPLKIALLSHWYWEECRIQYDEEGGSIRQLAEAMAGLGHEVVVLSQSPEVRKLRQIQLGTLETWVSPRGKSRSPFSALRDRLMRKKYSYEHAYSDARTLKEFLAKRGPFDVLWAQAESPDGLVVALARKLHVKLPPLLVQVQSLRHRFEKSAPVLTHKLPLDLAFRQASRILANSEMVAEMITRFAGPGHSVEDLKAKTRVVYPNLQRCFIDAGKMGPTEPLPDRVLFLGELTQQKGALVFMKALGKTEASRRSSVFVVIGGFTEYNRRQIKRWEDAQEATRIKLFGARRESLGHVTSLEVVRQIKLASVVVVPSLFDPFARGVVEALSLGRPVITTDQVGAAPIVTANQCGIVIPANDSDALARAIDIVLSPLIPFAENARRVGPRIAHEFSSEVVAGQIEYHLGRIAGHPPVE
jgi:glycosyltransferase involved in cell wall biosynthesis